jgi:hypothetical protein
MCCDSAAPCARHRHLFPKPADDDPLCTTTHGIDAGGEPEQEHCQASSTQHQRERAPPVWLPLGSRFRQVSPIHIAIVPLRKFGWWRYTACLLLR